MKKLGNRPQDTGNSPQLTIVLPKHMLDLLVEEAWKRKTTRSALIREYISDGLKHKRSKNG